MCGIAGIIQPNTGQKAANNKEKVIESMVSAIVHRGPDDDGFFVDDTVGLGMRRLSIIDLSTGRQPITTSDEKSLIFFNGEIYNYKELRAELVKKKYVFKTNTDTEVILHMFEEYGPKMLTKLRGMFTFCIYNTETKKVFLARDYFGIKPLYYLIQGEKVVAFSSEIKSFLSYPGYVPEVNDAAVVNYLSFQYNPLVETFFKNVFKLAPAHYMTIDTVSGEVDIQKYWEFEFDQDDRIDEKLATDKIHEVMLDSVEHHMIADVPVGAFLSGGVDSSIIATLMQKIRGKKKIKTFTIGFDSLTEGVESKETADFLGTDHTEIKIEADEYFKALPKAVYHFDEPVADPSAIGLYFIARETAKHVKVVLSGEGADELFGGYNIYLAPFASAKLVAVPKGIIDLFLKLSDYFAFEFFGKNYLKRVSLKLEDWYIGNASIFKKDEVKSLWIGKKEKTMSLSSLYKNTGNVSDSTKMQYVDIHTWLVGDILAKADKMTMAHSLELRVPFLDIAVANLASILPDRFKWRGGVTKYLLREAFKDVIPETTRNRKKLGFPTPVRDWFTKERFEVYKTIMENKYIKSHMNVAYIQNIIDEHTSKKTDNSRKIYLLLMLALWYNTFIEPIK